MQATYTPPTLRQRLSIVWAEALMRLTYITRYKGQLVLDTIIPIIITTIPLFLGRAVAGDAAAEIFAQNTGTSNYVAYLLIGSSTFTLVSSAFWHVAWWVRFEQETGTLEAIYLTPNDTTLLVAGVAVYSAVRGILTMIVSYTVGCLIFRVNPFTGDLLLTFGFILAGLIPLYAMTLFFGAVVLKMKESNALINLMQWVVSFLMGIYFPITVMPPLARWVALAFPPTWMTNGVRSALLGVGFFFEQWYLDLAILGVFVVSVPWLGVWLFNRVEYNVRSNEGVGQF